MIKKTVGILVCILLVINFIPLGSSTVKSDNELICNNQNTGDDEYNGNLCYQYPVMNKTPYFDPQDASPKPEIKDTPDQFSWRDYENQDWLTPVKKQLCGDCWDYAALGTLESIINIRENCAKLDPDLSEQYVLSCLPSSGSCHGGITYLAFKYIMETTEEGNYHNGIIPETCFPYQADDDIPCSDKCTDWEAELIPILDYGQWQPDGSAEDREAIKTQVIETGPVAAGIMSTDYFAYWGSTHHEPEDYFPYIKEGKWINHIVIILGWKDDSSIKKGGYWIVKNSWGTDWGYDGFFNIEYGTLSIDSSEIIWVDYDPESINWDPVADTGGLYFGEAGHTVFFDGRNSFDAENDISNYIWDFGDETTDIGVSPTHIYSQQGIYPVTLSVTDNGGNTGVDTTWVWIDESADPPDKPLITGPQSGIPGEEYEYDILTTDANGDDIYYCVDWGYYRSAKEWIGPFTSGESVSILHVWSAEGDYQIKVKAKDSYDLESDWALLSVTMPKSKVINRPFINFLQNHPYLFTLLRHLLRL